MNAALVYIDRQKGTLVGQQDGLWLVDCGKEIVKSKYEPVTHALAEGWYLRDGKAVYVTPLTAWARDGKLIPVYQYVDHSRPPFGSSALYEHELLNVAKIESPYASDEEVEQILSDFYTKLSPLKKQREELDKQIKAIESEKREALKRCQHDWQKDGDEEDEGRNGFGSDKSQLWTCTKCTSESRQHFTRLA